jgi:glycosyltransferase involved in cell wall biosynthesis
VKISCILPVHNGARFLAEAIDSVLDQAYYDLELIVVDDGSTDHTMEILAEFRNRVRVLRQDHKGCAAARNLGLEEATGSFIAFQDADDLWMPGKLELQTERFRARPDLELCAGLIQNFWMEDVAEEGQAFSGHPFAEPIPGVVLPVTLARRSLFKRVGRFNEDLWRGSDTEWFLRAREAGAIHEIPPELVAKRRLHSGNLTRDDLASRENLLASMKASLDRRRQTGAGGPGARD